MTSAAYMVQVLDGYMDSRPSWRRVFVGRHSGISKETAAEAARELRDKNPSKTYRVRKISRRRIR